MIINLSTIHISTFISYSKRIIVSFASNIFFSIRSFMSNKTINFSHRSTLFLFVTKYHAEMEDKNLTLEQEAQIKEKAAALKAEKKVRKVYPMVVFGDTDCGEKEFYVAYMGEPTFPQFSKFMAASKKDEVNAMRQLARDCFLDGDKELVDNESLFLFGLMSQLSEIITTRQSLLVN